MMAHLAITFTTSSGSGVGGVSLREPGDGRLLGGSPLSEAADCRKLGRKRLSARAGLDCASGAQDMKLLPS
jgi:hypothetical protein